MKVAMYIAVIALVLIVVGIAYVRLAPTDVTRWHQAVDAAARDLPRTRVLAGSVEEGRITYVTRSAMIGFPDFTTIEYSDGQLKMFARLRFGYLDMGVNAKRLQGLLAAVEG
jgi:uncharacterized protein (DUF1499 family)